MNESNDEKKKTPSEREILTKTTRKYKHRKYRPVSEMRNALILLDWKNLYLLIYWSWKITAENVDPFQWHVGIYLYIGNDHHA